MVKLKFSIQHQDPQSLARICKIQTDHSIIETPVFMPVGTHGNVKTLSPNDLYDLNTNIMLSNTYHLYLRPGTDTIKKAGGLHKFINWNKSILTDSGGYQVFSLSNLNKIEKAGVTFQSHIDGSKHFFSPIASMEVQRILGSDIIMAFDYCPPANCSLKELRLASSYTEQWTKEAFSYLKSSNSLYEHQQIMFPIIQGGINLEERSKCLDQMLPYAECGLAIGGLSVGEKKEPMLDIVEFLGNEMPKNQPRYLMGVGKPTDLVKAILRGIDMFDCVLPARNARNGQIFTHDETINIHNSKYKNDHQPIDMKSNISFAKNFSKAYLRHLFKVNEMFGYRIATLINISYYFDLIEEIKSQIKENTFLNWSKEYLNKFESND